MVLYFIGLGLYDEKDISIRSVRRLCMKGVYAVHSQNPFENKACRAAFNCFHLVLHFVLLVLTLNYRL